MDGRVFVSTAVTKDGAPFALVPGSRVKLDFTRPGKLRLSADCNILGGDVDVSDGRITVSVMGMTLKGCSEELTAQDEWLAAVLTARPFWELSGPRLRISTDEVAIEFTEDVA